MPPTQSTPFTRKSVFVPDLAPSPLANYAHAVKAGPFVFLAGQGARSPETGKEAGVVLNDQGQVESYDIEVQTHAVLRNLKAVLAASGCTLQDLVEVNVFLADMKDFARYNEVYNQYFNFPNPPARTTIEARPPGHNYIEMKGIALMPERSA